MEVKVACPRCQSPLKSNRPIPAGMKVKCPRCGTLFNTPAATLAAVAIAGGAAANAGAPTAANGILSAAYAPHAAPPHAAAPPMAVTAHPHAAHPLPPPRSDLAPVPPGPAGKGTMLAIVLGGGAALLVVVVLLVLLCFSGDKPEQPNSTPGQDNFQPVVQKKPAPEPLIVLPPEEQKKVDHAINTGADFLRKAQLPNGTWPGDGGHPTGYAAMAGLTLLETGAKKDDPVIVKAAKFVRDAVPRLTNTYELSLAVLFLNKLAGPEDTQLIQELTLRLVAGQTVQGGWGYGCPVLSKEEHDYLFGILTQLKDRPPEDVARGLGAGGGKPVPPRLRNLAVLQPNKDQPDHFFRQGGDNSNTQFAILALWAARGHKVPLDRTLKLIDKRFRSTQNADGRWTYNGQGEVTPLPTMTCAGLLGVAIGHGLKEAGKGGLRPDQDPLVQKGLEHLAKSIGQPGESKGKPRMLPMYFLWSVERVGMLYQLKTINGKKWYHWGVEMLTQNQHPDGHWRVQFHGSSDVMDTCFAILFLHRVNLAKDLTDKLNELAAAAPAAAGGQPPARKD